jgi:hypothetical protein
MKVVFLCNKLSKNKVKSLSGDALSESGRLSPVVSIVEGKAPAAAVRFITKDQNPSTKDDYLEIKLTIGTR